MGFDAPDSFVIGTFLITIIGFLLPVRIEGREDYLVIAYAAVVAGAVLGPRAVILTWSGVVVAFPLVLIRHLVIARDPRVALRGAVASIAYASVTVLAVTAGFGVGNFVYMELLDGTFPMPMSTMDELVSASAAGFGAWVGTMTVRVLSLRVMTGSLLPRAFDPFDSVLIPYVLPVIGGVPLVIASIAAYRPDEPLLSIVLLSWCFPLYGASWYELHRRSLALDLRKEVLARQRLAAIGEVSARIVHQSRHQVGLMGWSVHRLRGLLRESPGDRLEAAEAELDALDEAKDRLSEMLASELLHESTESGDLRQPVKVITIADAIGDVTKQLMVKAEKRSVSVGQSIDGDMGSRWVPGSIRDVLFNLVDNAIDAAEASVQVVLAGVGHQPGGQGRALVELSVVDDGPGLPDRDAERSFEPFFTTKPDGTGMGLAIADALVGDMGGTLSYTREGGRTHFVVALPLEPAGVDPPG